MDDEHSSESQPKETLVRRIVRELRDLLHLLRGSPVIFILVVTILLAMGGIWLMEKGDFFKKEKAQKETGKTSDVTASNSGSNSGVIVGQAGPVTINQYGGGPPTEPVLMPDDLRKELDDVFYAITNVDNGYQYPFWKKLPKGNMVFDASVRDVQNKWLNLRQSNRVRWEMFSNEICCMDLAFDGYHQAAYADEHAFDKRPFELPPGDPQGLYKIYVARTILNLTNLISSTIFAIGAADTDEPVIRIQAHLGNMPDTTNDLFYPFVASSAMITARQAMHHAQDGFQKKLNQ